MAATNNMHNLTTLIKRLEAATSRLEDIATVTELPKGITSSTLTSPPDTSALSTPAPAVVAVPPPPVPSSEPLPDAIAEYDSFIRSTVDKFNKLSEQIGGSVARQAAFVLKAIQEQRKFLLVAIKAKKPADTSAFQAVLTPTSEAMMAAMEVKESNRADPHFTHLSAVAEGIMALMWVTVDNKPFKHVEEMIGSAQFWGNRLLKDFKDKDPKQVEWLQSFYQVLKDLREYTSEYHANGLVWNANGQSPQEVAKSLASPDSVAPPPGPPTARSSGGPPPPPPPPPPGPPPKIDIKTESAPAPSNAAGGFGAVFSELNKGESVTSGLRKVEKSEMTHKNPSLRATSNAANGLTRSKSPAPGKKPKPESMRMKKPAKKELEGNKWTIENFEKEPQPIEIETTLSQSILISRCNNTTVIVRGKGNQVTVENSTRLSLVVDTLVSTVDVVKANNFALQVLGSIPTVMLDQVDSAQIYFSKESTGAKVFTSKSAGVNLNVISGPDEDYKEVPLPSQICSYYDETKQDLVNEIVDHAG